MAQYTKNPPLIEAEVQPDPYAQFERWFADAEGAGLVEPTAMVLATVDADGQPSARVLLYKGWYEGGLCFYTNYDSRKGEALAANPRAAATFWWDRLERSVRFEGRVRKLPESLSEQYFHSRPRGSQIGAWTSRQSQVVEGRDPLEARLAENEHRYFEGEVPLPPHWGGYALVPERVEFWQGRLNRLHDRLRYRRLGESWLLERLEP
ncbi:MAG: pyridoxamine 5'-phosphate oxidase [Nevskiaceae bacterium]|nr:MAG: pyridoxamine 5'-phosphate oxidase [Nevskiaceae bacterium]TAM28618.1 MAG: pyridoxamine 5'-phosphate oxidase [Nevskiaceae bacterium]